MNYLQFDFSTTPQINPDTLVAILSANKFEGFEEREQLLKAYIPEKDFDEVVITQLKTLFPSLAYNRVRVENKNWNAEWEANFLPVIVHDYVGIRAHFHQPIPQTVYEIIITPKMSFGTGHHSTTFMMVQLMRELDFRNKSVVDFGTGTGILAILAWKSGAKNVVAIDNDDWSIENAKENFLHNGSAEIALSQADILPANKTFDIVLANINLNVIVSNIKSIAEALNEKGLLLLSGFLPDDLPALKEVLTNHKITFLSKIERNNWLALRATKQSKTVLLNC